MAERHSPTDWADVIVIESDSESLLGRPGQQSDWSPSSSLTSESEPDSLLEFLGRHGQQFAEVADQAPVGLLAAGAAKGKGEAGPQGKGKGEIVELLDQAFGPVKGKGEAGPDGKGKGKAEPDGKGKGKIDPPGKGKDEDKGNGKGKLVNIWDWEPPALLGQANVLTQALTAEENLRNVLDFWDTLEVEENDRLRCSFVWCGRWCHSIWDMHAHIWKDHRKEAEEIIQVRAYYRQVWV